MWCCGEPMQIVGEVVVLGQTIDNVYECDFCGKRTDEEFGQQDGGAK